MEGREGGRDQTTQERCRQVVFQPFFVVKNLFENLLEAMHMLTRKDHTHATLACNIRTFTAAGPHVHPTFRLRTSEKVKTTEQSKGKEKHGSRAFSEPKTLPVVTDYLFPTFFPIPLDKR